MVVLKVSEDAQWTTDWFGHLASSKDLTDDWARQMIGKSHFALSQQPLSCWALCRDANKLQNWQIWVSPPSARDANWLVTEPGGKQQEGRAASQMPTQSCTHRTRGQGEPSLCAARRTQGKQRGSAKGKKPGRAGGSREGKPLYLTGLLPDVILMTPLPKDELEQSGHHTSF